jgi:hypothetical protein
MTHIEAYVTARRLQVELPPDVLRPFMDGVFEALDAEDLDRTRRS